MSVFLGYYSSIMLSYSNFSSLALLMASFMTIAMPVRSENGRSIDIPSMIDSAVSLGGGRFPIESANIPESMIACVITPYALPSEYSHIIEQSFLEGNSIFPVGENSVYIVYTDVDGKVTRKVDVGSQLQNALWRGVITESRSFCASPENISVVIVTDPGLPVPNVYLEIDNE